MALREQTNPELELLRMKALSTARNEELREEIEELIRITTRIHAGFLFLSPKTLQPLLRAFDSANSGYDVGWQMFGDKLGLDVTILKVINNNQFNHEGPVYNTLLHYVQYDDATIGKIVKAFLEMERLDVLARSKNLIMELAEVILSHERDLMRSSAPTSDYGSLNSNEFSDSELSVPNEVIIKPSVLPDAPFIMKNLQATPLLSTLLLQRMTESRRSVICSPTFSEALTADVIQTTTPLRATPALVERSTSKKYALKVMLTFAADGEVVARDVARILRQERGCSRIGVLILGEQLSHLLPDPCTFITKSFLMVDYVVPILTKGYMGTILRKVQVEVGAADCVDARYVPYIYQTMVQDYLQRNCHNHKIRCLIPDEDLEAVTDNLMMASPLFLAWERVSKTHALADRILADNV